MVANHFLKIAAKASYAHDSFAHAKVCAIIVRKRKIVSIGFNQKQTHPLQALFGRNDFSIHLHAEIDALRHAVRILGEDLQDCILYVARTKENGDIGLACPCEGCMKAIDHFNVKDVVYTKNGTGNIFEERWK